MLIRRCAVLYIEPREHLDMDWAALFAGQGAIGATLEWVALAPHVGSEIVISGEEVELLGRLGPTLWQEVPEDLNEALARLLELGLLISDAPEGAAWRERDEVLRSQHWRGLSATAHIFSRWGGMQVDKGMQFPTFQELVAAHGAPPSAVVQRGGAPQPLPPIPRTARSALDDTLFRRYTGRNYDSEMVLPLDTAARLLQRAFGAQDEREMAPGATVLKKLSPSAGGLHPTEVYVLAQRVQDVAPGLYHYQPRTHALAPLAAMDSGQTRQLALRMVADQDWFIDAPMLVVLAARVERNFWKYRNHAKAYRALLLDAGHLSQTFYLLASEAGLAAFVTAAVNEVEIEQALGLDPLTDMVVAVCGCGAASGEQTTVELRL